MKKHLLLIAGFATLGMGTSLAQSSLNPLDRYITDSDKNEFVVIGQLSDGLSTPVDLDFHPERVDELWVLNQGSNIFDGSDGSGGTNVIFPDAYEDDPDAMPVLTDGNNWHFMAIATAMDFSENGNWTTSQGIQHANTPRNGLVPPDNRFVGPSMWSGDLSIHAQNHGGNGSHLDMLHQTPYGMGIAHEVDNVWWTFDGGNGNLARYDFALPHVPGGSDHDDGRIRRYTEVDLTMDPDAEIPSHMVVDKDNGWLYIAHTTQGEILRVDINSGSVANPLFVTNFEVLAEYNEMTGVTQEVYITGLDAPCGIDYKNGRLVVTDNGTSEIIIYDVEGSQAEELGRLTTAGLSNVMGVKVSPRGHIWFVDYDKRNLIKIDNFLATTDPATGQATGSEQEDEIVLQSSLSVFPNPSNGQINVKVSNLSSQPNFNVQLFDVMGKMVSNEQRDLSKSQVLDFSNQPRGVYFLQMSNGVEKFNQKLVINH